MAQEKKAFSLEEFSTRVATVAHKVDPALQVAQAGADLLLVSHPGSGDQIWVKAMDSGEKFSVLKTRNGSARPAQLAEITPVGEGFLGEILGNYVREIGHFRI